MSSQHSKMIRSSLESSCGPVCSRQKSNPFILTSTLWRHRRRYRLLACPVDYRQLASMTTAGINCLSLERHERSAYMHNYHLDKSNKNRAQSSLFTIVGPARMRRIAAPNNYWICARRIIHLITFQTYASVMTGFSLFEVGSRRYLGSFCHWRVYS